MIPDLKQHKRLKNSSVNVNEWNVCCALFICYLEMVFNDLQLQGDDPKETAIFFNWYYWCINVGTLGALGGIAYMQQQMAHGFFYGFIVGAASLVLGLAVFLTGIMHNFIFCVIKN